MRSKKNMDKVPEHLDHLVYTTSNLKDGMDKIEKLLGVRPIIGGNHPDYGTHNAQLSIGDSIYLEIIAPIPNLSPPKRGVLFQKSFEEHSKLKTWVLRSENIEALYKKAVSNGLTLGPIKSGKREKPDGSIISWKLSDPYANLFDGAVPFLISWGKTPHPANAIPNAGKLVDFVIEHPNPEQLRSYFKILGVDMIVNKADRIKLIAKIKTKNGMVILE